jgi:hypothetical protein
MAVRLAVNSGLRDRMKPWAIDNEVDVGDQVESVVRELEWSCYR